VAVLGGERVQRRAQGAHQVGVALAVGRRPQLHAVGRAVVGRVLPVDVDAVEGGVRAQEVGGRLRERGARRRLVGQVEERIRSAPAAHGCHHLDVRRARLEAGEGVVEAVVDGGRGDLEVGLARALGRVLGQLARAADVQERVDDVRHAVAVQRVDQRGGLPVGRVDADHLAAAALPFQRLAAEQRVGRRCGGGRRVLGDGRRRRRDEGDEGDERGGAGAQSAGRGGGKRRHGGGRTGLARYIRTTLVPLYSQFSGWKLADQARGRDAPPWFPAPGPECPQIGAVAA